jgi:hypothetical protein
MSAKIINAISALIEENGNEDFIALWNDEKKEEILAMLKKLEKSEKKAAKKDKDENAPKKNVSAWILFSKAERPKIKKEFPKMKPQEVMAELSKRWKIAKEDEEVMKEFAEKAKQDKERYEEEKKDYVAPEVDSDDETPKKSKKTKKAKKEKKVKAEGEPKRAKSAWLFFCDAERKNLAKEENAPKGKEVLGELSKRWKALSDKKKKKYNKLAEEAKEQYTEDMKKFKAAKNEDENEDEIEVDEAEVETEVDEDD